MFLFGVIKKSHQIRFTVIMRRIPATQQEQINKYVSLKTKPE